MKVTTDQTCDFAEHWRCDGVFVKLEPAAIKFATDWANICLVSFMEMMVERQKKKQAAAKAAETPVIEFTGAGS